MARYEKKNRYDATDVLKSGRSQRKPRGHKYAAMTGADKLERHHGWGYAKRRSVLLAD